MQLSPLNELNQKLIEYGIENVVKHVIGDNYNRSGSHLSMSSYLGGKSKSGGSFQIPLAGNNAGYWFENNPSDLPPNGKSSGDLIEFWRMCRGLSNHLEARKEIEEFLGISSSPKLSVVNGGKGKKRLSLEGGKPVATSTIEKYKHRLNANPQALEYLTKRGLSLETIAYFKVGLSTPYTNTEGNTQQNALVFPLMDRTGTFVIPYSYYNIPGVTEYPVDDNGWCASQPKLYYNQAHTTQDVLVVCEGFKDLWILHQHLAETTLLDRILLCTSTHGARVPDEVVNQSFRYGIKAVYLAADCDDAGDEICKEWAQHTGTETYRLAPPLSGESHDKDWTDYFAAGNTISDFRDLINAAPKFVSDQLFDTPTNIADLKPNSTYTINPVDVSCGYLNGQMYYPVWVHQTGIDPETNTMAHGRVIKVVRSDKVVLDYRALPLLKMPGVAPTPFYALSDGTLINDIPKVPNSATWQWHDIYRWIEGMQKVRSLSAILEDIESFFKTQIWLPNEDDYTILSLVTVVTFIQTVFDAVPLILATGAAGTGKSHIGGIMAKLCCNGMVLGDTSAATITRILDETRGFIVLDDVEKINKSMKNGNLQVDDFLQILKVSYKKSTAIRAVTDPKTMLVKTLNSYGVKFLTNTLGIEEILGTRTIQIHTRKAPPGFEIRDYDESKIIGLRNELHAFTMEYASKFEEAYKKYSTASRPEEITAPLRAVIDVAGIDAHAKIDRVIERMETEKRNDMSPTSFLKEAFFNIGLRGFNSVTLEQIQMEMMTLIPSNYGKTYTTEIADYEKTDWIKKAAMNLGYISSAAASRKRIYGTTPMQRIYNLEPAFYADLGNEFKDEYEEIILKTPMDASNYCKQYSRCMECPYNSVECKIRERSSKK